MFQNQNVAYKTQIKLILNLHHIQQSYELIFGKDHIFFGNPAEALEYRYLVESYALKILRLPYQHL